MRCSVSKVLLEPTRLIRSRFVREMRFAERRHLLRELTVWGHRASGRSTGEQKTIFHRRVVFSHTSERMSSMTYCGQGEIMLHQRAMLAARIADDRLKMPCDGRQYGLRKQVLCAQLATPVASQ